MIGLFWILLYVFFLKFERNFMNEEDGRNTAQAWLPLGVKGLFMG
jgi:hypothetical protein